MNEYDGKDIDRHLHRGVLVLVFIVRDCYHEVENCLKFIKGSLVVVSFVFDGLNENLEKF